MVDWGTCLQVMDGKVSTLSPHSRDEYIIEKHK